MVECCFFPRMRRRTLSRATTAVLVALSVVVAGCTTMKSVEMSSEELRTAIRAGEVAQPGQRVVVVTANGDRHAFTFQGVDTAQDVVRGEGPAGEPVAVAIGDIVELRMPATDGVKTAAVIVSVVLAVFLAIAADAAEDFVEIFDFR